VALALSETLLLTLDCVVVVVVVLVPPAVVGVAVVRVSLGRGALLVLLVTVRVLPPEVGFVVGCGVLQVVPPVFLELSSDLVSFFKANRLTTEEAEEAEDPVLEIAVELGREEVGLELPPPPPAAAAVDPPEDSSFGSEAALVVLGLGEAALPVLGVLPVLPTRGDPNLPLPGFGLGRVVALVALVVLVAVPKPFSVFSVTFLAWTVGGLAPPDDALGFGLVLVPWPAPVPGLVLVVGVLWLVLPCVGPELF